MSQPNIVKQTQPGYSGGQSMSRTPFAQREGDPELRELWKRYTSHNARSETWKFRKEVLKVAKRLLGAEPNWFQAQDKNPYLVAYNYEFVQDTLRYITTGYRRISIYSWDALVSYNSKPALDAIVGRKGIGDYVKRHQVDQSLVILIQQWVSHPGGFDDLIRSLNIMFGDITYLEENTKKTS